MLAFNPLNRVVQQPLSAWRETGAYTKCRAHVQYAYQILWWPGCRREGMRLAGGGTAISLRAVLLLVLVLSGCASSGVSRAPNKAGAITQREIDDSGFTFVSAHDVVRQLRPQWLIKRGVSTFAPTGVSDTLLDFIAVYVDNQLMGDLEALRRVSPLLIQTIRFLDTAQAQRLGSRSHIHGAIVVKTRS